MHTQYWEPGTQYNYDDVVEYKGHRYKIIEPHRAQSDWAPGPDTASLWGRLSDEDPNYGGGYNQQQGCQGQQPNQQQQPQGQHDQKSQSQSHTNEPSKHEEKKQWYQNEQTKKELEIGGGLAVGAALLAGGLFAYKKHEEHKEAAKVDVWSHDNWLNEAKERRDKYLKNGSPQAATWVLTEGRTIPDGAILVGREHSWNLYICRAFHDGGIQLGKASEAFEHGGVLGYKNKEVFVNEYEVLVGDMNSLRWVPSTGQLNVSNLRYRPVEGGQENNGSRLYIAEAPHNNFVHPGKASEHLEGAYIPYGGKETNVREYRVLCYND